MSTANRDIRLQALVLGEFQIPLGGDTISARLSHGTVGEMQRGTATNIKTQPGKKDGVLTISVYPEDAASPILRQLYNSRKLPGTAAVPLAGSAVNTGTGETSTWADAHFTEVGDVPLGTASEIVTYVLALSDLETLQAAT